MIRLRERSSSPQVNILPSRPPLAASSHSVSVGRSLLAQVAYAWTSSQHTCTTGCLPRFATLLRGPSGCFQQAPGTQTHQLAMSFSGTGPVAFLKTSEPGTSIDESTSG